MKNVYFSLFVVISVIIIAGCGKNFYSDNKKIEMDIIKMGAISPLTGNASPYGDPAGKAYLLAVDKINSEGGILGKKIKLILEDGMCDATSAANATNKLVFIDKVSIILGGNCSTESLTIAPIANENKVIQLASITSSSNYTNAGEYSFRNFPASSYYQTILGEVAYKKGARNVAIIYEQKDYPVSAKEAFTNGFLGAGGKISMELSFLSNETNYRGYLTRIKINKAVDSIFFANVSESGAVQFFKTMKELDMIDKYLMLANDDPITKKVYQESGGLNKNVFTTNVYADPKNPRVSYFLELYKNKYGDYPQTNYYYAAAAYDAVFIARDAIEYCNELNSECIKNYLKSLENWEGTTGKITFDENGDIKTDIFLNYFDYQGNEIFEDI